MKLHEKVMIDNVGCQVVSFLFILSDDYLHTEWFAFSLQTIFFYTVFNETCFDRMQK